MPLSLTDRMAIQDLIVFYAHLCDTRQLDRVAAEIFTEDAVVNYGLGQMRGHAEINAFYTGHTEVVATSHNLTNFLVEGDGDEAVCHSRALAWHWFGDSAEVLNALPPADMLAIGGYQDRLRRTAAGWRVADRYCVQFGSGLGVGEAGVLAPLLTGMLGRLPIWPPK